MDRQFLRLVGTLSVATFGGVWMMSEPADSNGRRAGHATLAVGHVYYPDCDAARAAGVAPMLRDDPGYRPSLDGDDDGIACEPHRR